MAASRPHTGKVPGPRYGSRLLVVVTEPAGTSRLLACADLAPPGIHTGLNVTRLPETLPEAGGGATPVGPIAVLGVFLLLAGFRTLSHCEARRGAGK